MRTDMLPLDGFSIGVTADRRAEEQCEMFRRRGARVLHGPVIRTLPLAADSGIRAATEALIAAPPDVVIANTGIGIRSWFASAEAWGLGDALLAALASARILARGPKAAGAVLTAGLAVAWRAPSESLGEVVAELLREPIEGVRVAVQLDGNREQPDAQLLRAAGGDIVEVPVYSWTRPDEDQPAVRLLHAACDRNLDAVTFTSAAAIRNFFDFAIEHGRADALRDALNGHVVAMCVGPTCAETATAYGVNGIEPPRARLGSMVHTLTEQLVTRRRHLRVRGHAGGSTEVVVQGALVTVGETRASLSDRERAVLDVLMARAGAVVGRGELLRSVWGATADEHALEVTVARLRRRLGTAGRAIKTVVRRGYRLDATLDPISGPGTDRVRPR